MASLLPVSPHGHHSHADNLTAKTEPFLDDFEDGNATGWNLGTGWSASTKVIKEDYGTVTRITRNNGQNDIDILFRHMTTDATGMPSCPGPTHSSGVMVQVGRVGRPAIRWGCRGTRWVSSTDRMLTSTAVPILMYSLIQVGWRVAL